MVTRDKFGLFNLSNSLVFSLYALVCVFPLYYILVLTLSDNQWAASGVLVLYPKGFHLQNYVNVLRFEGILPAMFVSVLKTVVGTACTLLGTSFLAYLFTKKGMFLRKALYRFVIISMYFNAGLIPWYINMRNLQLTNNFLGYIVPYIVMPFYLILMKTYMESIPPALEESASIDGAGTLQVFFRIIFPLSRPILATVAVFESVNQWNNLKDNLFLMTRSRLHTLQYILYNYMSEVDALAARMRSQAGAGLGSSAISLTPMAVRMTVAMLVVLPILFVYPVLQRHFAKGIMLGAMKG